MSVINDEIFINAFKQGKKVCNKTGSLFSGTKTNNKIEPIRGRSKSLSLSNIEFVNLEADTNTDSNIERNIECIMELHRKKYESIISSRPAIKRLISN